MGYQEMIRMYLKRHRDLCQGWIIYLVLELGCWEGISSQRRASESHERASIQYERTREEQNAQHKTVLEINSWWWQSIELGM